MSRIGSVLGMFVGAAALVSTGASDGAASNNLQTNAHAFVFDLPDGSELPLKQFAGKPVLVVNTATECGFSGQFAELQELHERYAARGLVVLAVPSNDFGGQEPRKDGEIAGYCEAKYGAQFLMTAKTGVKGKNAHPFYRWAKDSLGPMARPYWNFHKYIVGPDGSIVAWFSTPTSPTLNRIINEIEKQLAGIN